MRGSRTRLRGSCPRANRGGTAHRDEDNHFAAGHAFGADDIDDPTLYGEHRPQILFFEWVTLTEHKWVTLGERRRRIHNKVYIGAVEPPVFDEIFRRVALSRGLAYSPEVAACVRDLCWRAGCTELRACYPGDLCRIAESIASFEDRPAELSAGDLERAVALYFTRPEPRDEARPRD